MMMEKNNFLWEDGNNLMQTQLGMAEKNYQNAVATKCSGFLALWAALYKLCSGCSRV